MDKVASGNDDVVLVSNQYAVTFSVAYYSSTAMKVYTIADPRFRDTTDLLHQANGRPSKILFVARAGTPIPAILGGTYPVQRQLGELARRSEGCAPEYYSVTMLRR